MGDLDRPASRASHLASMQFRKSIFVPGCNPERARVSFQQCLSLLSSLKRMSASTDELPFRREEVGRSAARGRVSVGRSESLRTGPIGKRHISGSIAAMRVKAGSQARSGVREAAGRVPFAS